MSGVMGIDSYMFIVSVTYIIRILEVKPYNIYLLEFDLTVEGLYAIFGVWPTWWNNSSTDRS